MHRSLPIIVQIQGFVHKDFSPVGYGDHPRSRSAHGVRVYDYNANRVVGVTHMHGVRDLNGKMETPERALQARRLLDLSRRVTEPGDFKIICGDFNVEPTSETLSILRDAGMTELVTAGSLDGTRTSHYKKKGRFADYMLVSEKQAVKRFAVVRDPEVSDHCPLVLEI